MGVTIKHISTILLVSGVVAVVANSIHPRKIPWVQDWSRQIEAKAKAQEIRVIPFSVALKKFRDSGGVVFLDARPAEDYAAGRIPGAISIPVQLLDERLDRISGLVDSGRELVLYCTNRDCDDALVLATELQAMGADHLSLYIDGFEIWKQHGGLVEVGE